MKKVLIVCCWLMFIGILPAFGQERNCQPIDSLKERLTQDKACAELSNMFERYRDCFCRENKYDDFVAYLKSLIPQKKSLQPLLDYAIALTRYNQLNCLESTQAWDEYFNKGPAYREELSAYLQESIKLTSVKDATHVYSQLLLWEFYRSQEDVSSMDVLVSLMQSLADYAKEAGDPAPLKAVADKILAAGEKARAKELYRIYTAKITGADVKDEELKNIAEGFYKEANLELAESVYDAYIERLEKAGAKEKLIVELTAIAKAFSSRDSEHSDHFYAEKIFEKIESAAGKGALDEEMLYLRAFNLEKGKELKKARDIYVELVTRNADSPHLNEALFKIAAISAFGLRDLDTGREYFTKLAQKDKADPETVSALYYLGLLSQWKEDLAEAKKYYDKAMLVAADNYKDTIELVRQRLGEIGNNRPIEYNLKTFLDASLRPENSRFNMTKVGLQALPLSPKAADAVEITSTAASDSGGCMQVAMDYYWSGNTGSAKPSLTTSGFNTTYALPGTKALFLVVFAASEIVDRDFCLVDVR